MFNRFGIYVIHRFLVMSLTDSKYFAVFHEQATMASLDIPTEAVDAAMGLVTRDEPPDAQVCTHTLYFHYPTCTLSPYLLSSQSA